MGIRIWGEQTWIIQNQLTNSIMEGCILFIWIPLRVGNLDSCIMYKKMYLITFCQFPETWGDFLAYVSHGKKSRAQRPWLFLNSFFLAFSDFLKGLVAEYLTIILCKKFPTNI